MNLINDRQIIISAAGSRKATQWLPQSLFIADFYSKLYAPVRSIEPLIKFKAMPKGKQDDLKDVGGFIGGTLKDNRRKAGNVIGRDIITLDLDNIPPGGTNDVLRRMDGLGCAAAVYSTMKHEEAKPRLRALIFPNRTVTSDEYEPLTRKIASFIGIEFCDPSTFEASRLMYWPCCCSDSQYVFQYWDKPFLDADGLLAMYNDWRNVAEWPEVPGAQQAHVKLAAKQGNPLEKAGLVGAFCKIYDIYKAIDTFLPGEYTPCDDGSGRYTFTGGSTTGGAVVYDDGNFMYSHHATDPSGGKLVNAFDLVRLHKFSEMDDKAKPDTPTNKLPSYTAMCQHAVSDTQVAALINQERYEKATQDFNSPPGEDDNANWMVKLEVDSKNGGIKIRATPKNFKLILENDPNIKDKFAFDEFRKRIIVKGSLPWRKEGEDNDWEDADDSSLRNYISDVYGVKGKDIYNDSFAEIIKKKSLHPIKDYLNSLSWDGLKRVETLFVDYFGVEDNVFVRSFTKKWLCAAVKRILHPGCKFDYMLVLIGNQGVKKSTFFSKLSKGFFTDSMQDVNGKQAIEIIQGVWIVEFGELQAFSKSDNDAIKRFISATEDRYRPAYGRHTVTSKRQCIFVGTTNKAEFLTDNTGNRRYWILDCTDRSEHVNKDVFKDLEVELSQVWAEALFWYGLGTPLYPSKEEEEYLAKFQEDYKSIDDVEQALLDRLNWDALKEEWRDLTYTEIVSMLGLSDSQKRYARNNLKQLLAKRGILQFKNSTGNKRLYKIPPCVKQFSAFDN